MKNAKIPVLGFAAPSNTGKTTLLTKLIPLLRDAGLRVGLIKHCHHNFEIDQPEKDSYRLRKSGASPVMLVSSRRRAIITEFNTMAKPTLDTQLAAFDQSTLDLILVEGFKTEPLPKIELFRAALNHPLLFPNDPTIIALATDTKNIQLTPKRPTLLDLNQPTEIAAFILTVFLGGQQ